MTATPRPFAVAGLIRLARGRDWVQSKLPFLTAITVLLVPEVTASRALGIVATVMAGSAFGYALNEVADRASDARAGKHNRAAGIPRRLWLPFLILMAGSALGLSAIWAPDAAAPLLVLFSLGLGFAYSAPPLRLKERGAVGIVGAAAAQWAVPVLVVAAADPGGWLRAPTWAFALLGLVVGTRWIVIHQLGDALADRRSGVRTYFAGRTDATGLLQALLAGELVLLAIALASLWPRSELPLIALVPFVAQGLLQVLGHHSLAARLARYEQAPLAAYYFFVLPLAVALDNLIAARGSSAVSILLAATALPQLVALVRRRRAAGSAITRARLSTQRPVVSASEPHP